jgi:hypothetical protein
MFTALPTLTNLESLHLRFKSPLSYPDLASGRPPPPLSFLPALTELTFRGTNEYLEDLVARIDAPQLSTLHITFFNRMEFDTSKLVQFICRTPRLKALKKACVFFDDDFARINLSSQTSGHHELDVGILCRQPDLQLLSLMRVFTPSLPPPALEDLYIYEALHLQVDWRGSFEIMPWLELLRPFTTVKNLYLPKQFAPRIALALHWQGFVGSRATEVLPSLETIFVEGLEPSGIVQEGIEVFVAARDVSSHPIAVNCWERCEEEDADEDDDDDNDNDNYNEVEADDNDEGEEEEDDDEDDDDW